MSVSIPSVELQRFKFTFKLNTDLLLNEYSGSMLRGAFGAQLRRWACMTKAERCDGCLLRNTCPFGVIFSPQPLIRHGMQVRYIIEPPQIGKCVFKQGEYFCFNLVLIGQALNQLSLVIMVWEQLFKFGLKNRGDGCGDLINVVTLTSGDKETLVYKPSNNADEPAKLLDYSKHIYIPFLGEYDNLTINFVTPFRLSDKNKHLYHVSQFNAELILKSMYRRYKQLCDSNQVETQYLPPKAEDCDICLTNNSLKNFKWQRYSNKQQQKMSFDGFIGEVTLTGTDIEKWWPIIYLSQLWHIGQKVSFGLGKIEVLKN